MTSPPSPPSLHKGAVALALCVSFLKSGMPKTQMYMLLAFFTAVAPLGIAIGMGGVAVMLVPKGSLPEPGMITFVLIAFITPILYAGTTIYAARHKPPDADPLQMACGMMLASSFSLDAPLTRLKLASSGLATIPVMRLMSVFWSRQCAHRAG